MFFVSFIFLNFFSVVALEYDNGRGIVICFKVFATLTVLGGWIKYIGCMYSFWLVLFGQLLIAISQPFFSNAIGKIATVWFPDDQRSLATNFGSLAQPFGAIVALAIGPLFISEDDLADKQHARDRIIWYMLILALICTSICLPIIFLF